MFNTGLQEKTALNNAVLLSKFGLAQIEQEVKKLQQNSLQDQPPKKPEQIVIEAALTLTDYLDWPKLEKDLASVQTDIQNDQLSSSKSSSKTPLHRVFSTVAFVFNMEKNKTGQAVTEYKKKAQILESSDTTYKICSEIADMGIELLHVRPGDDDLCNTIATAQAKGCSLAKSRDEKKNMCRCCRLYDT